MRFALPAVLLLALLAHGAGLRNGFVYDDHRFIDLNTALGTASLQDLVMDPATQTSDADRDVWRPLRALSHRFDLRTGLGPFAFHLHSLLAQLAAVALGWLLLRRLLPEPSEVPALFGAALLALHPLGVEVVAWASSRGDLYAVALGYAALLAALAHGRTERPAAQFAWLAAAGIATFLAMLGKESAGWVPLVALLARWLLGRPRWQALVALAVGAAAGLQLRFVAMSGLSPVQTAPHGAPGEWLAWSLQGTSRTLAHVLWPAGLSVEYPQESWQTGEVWLAGFTVAGLAVVLAAIVLVLWRRRAPAVALLLGWALLAWLPSSSLLVTLRELVNDRGAYPLLLPLGALAGLALLRRPRLVVASAVVLAALLVPLTAARTLDWHDDGRLWQATLRVHPRSVRAALALSQVVARSDPQAQGRWLEQAVAVAQPDSALEGLARAAWGNWLLRVANEPDRAEPVLRRALVLLQHWRGRPWPRSEEAPTVMALAEALELTGRHDQGDALLAAALAEQPHHVALLVQRSALALQCWEQEHDEEALHTALISWRLAAELAPQSAIVAALGKRLAEKLPEGPPPSVSGR